jgi:hypothetical protein
MTSIYASITSDERKALAAGRNTRRDAGTITTPFHPTLPENEVPKCARYFDHDAACDLGRSHLCGPSDMAKAWTAMWAEIREGE